MNKVYLLVFVLLTGAQVQAQENLMLDEMDFRRLGIEFAPVNPVQEETGSRFPATVQSSPERQSVLIARYPGQIESWLVSTGDHVSAGQALLRIRSQEILDLQNQWLTALSMEDQAAYEWEKDQQLESDGIISTKRLTNTRRTYEQSRQRQISLREALHQAGMSDSDLEALRDGGGLGLYTLRTPAAGVLTNRAFVTGEFVSSNSVVATMNDGSLWVSAHLPARLAATLKVGEHLGIEGMAGALMLRQKDYAVDPGTQTVEVRAEIMSDSNLFPGQVVNLIVPPAGDGILVPASAVVQFDDRQVVYVRTASGVEARSLTLQPIGHEYVAMTGLSANDRIVVQGAAILKGIQLGLGGE